MPLGEFFPSQVTLSFSRWYLCVLCASVLIFLKFFLLQVTDGGLADVAENLHTLEHLTFSGCTSVTDMGVSLVAIHLQRLVALDASKCDNVTDKSILDLAKHSRNLTHLDLSMCSQITTNAVDQLEENIPGLASLQLRYSGARLCTKMYAL